MAISPDWKKYEAISDTFQVPKLGKVKSDEGLRHLPVLTACSKSGKCCILESLAQPHGIELFGSHIKLEPPT